MIQLIDKKNNLSQANMALVLSRYKRKGYAVIGVGYPFFRNEFQGLIEMCDYFVDDLQCEYIFGWKELYLIKDVSILELLERFVILALSNNRMNILNRIEILMLRYIGFTKGDIHIYRLFPILRSLQTLHCPH